MQLIEVLLNINYSDAPAWAHSPSARFSRDKENYRKKLLPEKCNRCKAISSSIRYKGTGRERENGMNGIMGVRVGDSCSLSLEQNNLGLWSNFVGDLTRFDATKSIGVRHTTKLDISTQIQW